MLKFEAISPDYLIRRGPQRAGHAVPVAFCSSVREMCDARFGALHARQVRRTILQIERPVVESKDLTDARGV